MSFTELLRNSPALADALKIVGGLIVILFVSLAVRAQVFCQYLEQMTGIELSPGEVRETFKRRGRDGVRELLLDKTIRADLVDGGPIKPPEA